MIVAARLMTALATYTVTESVDADGLVNVKFESTNPPRGHDQTIYEWTGRPASLTRQHRRTSISDQSEVTHHHG